MAKNSRDLNHVAGLEKAIERTYGADAVINPRSLWNEEKEYRYKEQVSQQKQLVEESVIIEKRDGFLIEKGLINKEKRKCEVCNKYSFNQQNDFYLIKYGTCEQCYILYIEGREERWLNGWRPEKERK